MRFVCAALCCALRGRRASNQRATIKRNSQLKVAVPTCKRKMQVIHFHQIRRNYQLKVAVLKLHCASLALRLCCAMLRSLSLCFALQKCMLERLDAVSHCKNACWSVWIPLRTTKMPSGRCFAFRNTKMHAGACGRYACITKMQTGASRRRFALQKCMPERPSAVSHYGNACRRDQTAFRVTKMHTGAFGYRFAL